MLQNVLSFSTQFSPIIVSSSTGISTGPKTVPHFESLMAFWIFGSDFTESCTSSKSVTMYFPPTSNTIYRLPVFDLNIAQSSPLILTVCNLFHFWWTLKVLRCLFSASILLQLSDIHTSFTSRIFLLMVSRNTWVYEFLLLAIFFFTINLKISRVIASFFF